MPDPKVIYFSPGYFHAREELFLYLAQRFDFKVVDVSHQRKNGTPSPDYLNKVSYAIWNMRSGKLSRMRWHDPLRLFYKMFRVFWKTHYDLVICSTQFPLHSKFALLLRPFFKYKLAYVNEVWFFESPRYRILRWNQQLAAWILKRADFILSEGTNSTRHLTERLGIAHEKILLWPMMCEDIGKRPIVTEEFPWKAIFERYRDRIKFGYVGRFVRAKGLEELLEAFQIVQRETQGIALFLIGGNGDYAEDLKQKADAINDCEVLPWAAPEYLPEIYRSLDVFVLPSHRDGFSTVCCEAAAMGCPLIVSDMVGGAPDLIEEHENGTIVKTRDVNSLSQALKYWGTLSRETIQQKGLTSRRLFKALGNYELHVNAIKAMLKACRKNVKK